MMTPLIKGKSWLWRHWRLDDLRGITREWNRIWKRRLELEALQQKLAIWIYEELGAKNGLSYMWNVSLKNTPQLKGWRRLKLRILSAKLAKLHGVEHFDAIYGILSARYAAPHMWQIVRERRINLAKKRGLNLDPREISVSDEASRFFVRSEQTCEGFVDCSWEVRHLFFRDVYV